MGEKSNSSNLMIITKVPSGVETLQLQKKHQVEMKILKNYTLNCHLQGYQHEHQRRVWSYSWVILHALKLMSSDLRMLILVSPVSHALHSLQGPLHGGNHSISRDRNQRFVFLLGQCIVLQKLHTLTYSWCIEQPCFKWLHLEATQYTLFILFQPASKMWWL